MTLPVAFAIAWGIVVAGLGAWLTDISPWYRALRKPSWQPPDFLFGPAWTLILGLASYAAYLALYEAETQRDRLVIIGLFVLNGALNIVWSPLFFRMRRPDLALLEVPVLWLSIAALIVGLAPYSHVASWFVAPYLAWVSFAAVLNLTIVRLNPPFGAQNR